MSTFAQQMNQKSSGYSIFRRIACFLMALHFLNLSIDSRDPNPDTVPEDLLFNDIESFAEFITEVALNKVNVFAEHDEKDSEEASTLVIYKFYFDNTTFPLKRPTIAQSSAEFWIQNAASAHSLVLNVYSPPPKV